MISISENMTTVLSPSRLKLLSRSAFQLTCTVPLTTTCLRLERVAVPLRKKKAPKPWNEHYKILQKFGSGSGKHFVDYIQCRVKAGNGGDGGISTLSVFRIEFAGPDGGNGGNGGHVLFKATKEVNSLENVKRVIRAQDGVPGKSNNLDGRNGKHQTILVPIGTVFRNLERIVIAELTKEGQIFLAAKGGAGGRGNAFFKSSSNQTPMLAEQGGIGEMFTFEVELRTMAHVGLLGFPNAGKSTFLRAISRARPKVASYPFTTLNPHIGIVEYDDFEQISIADLPGIIVDAHKNKGLGIAFLRHIERTKCLLYVIDLAQSDPIEQFEALKYELEMYQEGLSSRPHAVLANKIDDEKAKENVEMFREYMQAQNVPVFFISGKMSTNLRSVLIYIKQLCDNSEPSQKEEEQTP